jgi:hypothetical protein
MQVIPRTYDLVLWLIPRLKEFPREQCFLLGDRIQTGVMDLLSLLIEANYTGRKEDLLRQANLELEKTRRPVGPRPEAGGDPSTRGLDHRGSSNLLLPQ